MTSVPFSSLPRSGGLKPSNYASTVQTSSGSSQKSVPTILGRKRKSDVLDQDALVYPDDSATAMQLGLRRFTLSENVDDFEADFLFCEDASENQPPVANRSLQRQHCQPQQQISSRIPFSTLQSNNSNVSRQALATKSVPKKASPATSPSNRQKQAIIKSPGPKKLKMRPAWSEFREFVCGSGTTDSRASAPFPSMRWVDRQQMWDLMCKKESGMYLRKTGEELLSLHPAFQPRMRAILLDWLMEVCEVYRLHRETFYLAVDYIDRYLSVTRDMPKTRLQLIGVTCIFIAAKIEEIYPPKLSEFAYVTDGACTEEEILAAEMVVLKELRWGLSPMTPNAWMKTFMQASSFRGASALVADSFVLPNFSGLPFAKAMQLLDLCSLDMGFLSFRYSVLAASAMYHTQGMEVTEAASGYTWWDIADCVSWMSAFAFALRKEGTAIIEQKTFHCVDMDDQHNMQSHAVELCMLDRALEHLQQMAQAPAALRLSPEHNATCCFIADHVKLSEHLVTPPPNEGEELQEVELSSRTTLVSVSSTESVFLSPQTPGNAILANTNETFFMNTLNPDRGSSNSKTVVLK